MTLSQCMKQFIVRIFLMTKDGSLFFENGFVQRHKALLRIKMKAKRYGTYKHAFHLFLVLIRSIGVNRTQYKIGFRR
ncbi:hypothetical protein D3C84_898530 [compost metagenome]